MTFGCLSTFTCIYNFAIGFTLLFLYSYFLSHGYQCGAKTLRSACTISNPIWYHVGAIFTGLAGVWDTILVITSGCYMFFSCFGAADPKDVKDKETSAVIHFYAAYTGLDFLFRVVQIICLIFLFKSDFAKAKLGETIREELYSVILAFIGLKTLYWLVFTCFFCELYSGCCSKRKESEVTIRP